MWSIPHRAFLVAIAALMLPFGAAISGDAAPGPAAASADTAICGASAPGFAHCLAETTALRVGSLQVVNHATPVGWTPQQLALAYGVPFSTTAGSGQTIALVDAYDSPNVEADLNTFSKAYGLPACTTANKCFTKLNQNGAPSPLPVASPDWAVEINLDVEWAHAMAPGASIVLVEATTSSFANLVLAENTAKTRAGVRYISNSWGGSEFNGEALYDSAWAHAANQTVFFSAGDSGARYAMWPSAAPNVVSVGGTSLSLTGATASETVWPGGGGGCSAYEQATPQQLALPRDARAKCANNRRATPDLSAVADPSPGAGVYISTPISNNTGWFAVGGTSLAAPVVAALAARSGLTLDPATLYGSTMQWRDITAGTNGQTCLVGFDLCSGRGSWIKAGTTSSSSSATPAHH